MVMTQNSSINYYELLEIPTDSDERQIKRAYYRLARQLHPDKATSPEEQQSFEERFAQVSAAYNNLKDPAKRQAYDQRLKGGTGQPAQGTGSAPRTATAAVLAAGRSTPAPATLRRESTNQGNNNKGGGSPEKIQIAQKAYAKGMQLYKDGNFIKAIDFFEAAIQNNEAEAIYHARLAAALIEARKSATRALSAAQRAIDLDPYNMEHKFNLAMIFTRIGSKSNAMRIYEEIMRWDNGNLRAQQALAELKKKNYFAFLKPAAAATSGGSLGERFQQLLGHFRKSS